MAQPKPKERHRFNPKDLREAFVQYRQLAPYVLRYRLQLAVYFFGTLLFAAGNASRLVVIQPLMAFLAPNGDSRTTTGDTAGAIDFLRDSDIGRIALLLFGATLFMTVGTFTKQYTIQWIMHRSTLDVQRDLVRNLMRQPVSFFNVTRKGELMSRITNDLSGVRQTFFILFNDLVQHPIQIVAILSVMALQSPMLCLALLVFPVVLAPVVLFASKIRKYSRRSLESHAELTNFFHQLFEGVRVVKAFNSERQQEAELDRTGDEYFKRSRRVAKYMALSRSVVELVIGTLIAAGITLGAWALSTRVLGDDVDFGLLVTFMIGIVMLYDPIRKLSDTLNRMSNSMAANDRVFELMRREPELKDKPNAIAAPAFAREVEFRAVGFEYSAGRPVLADISFIARKGTMTAFVGATGAGKSTLMDLIPRFYAPTSGRILVDGTDLQDIQLASWLAQIAVVAQETFLFNSSVRENLLAGRREASDAELYEALAAANVYEEIMALPKGLDTILGDRGVNLSGGQRQRLAIARAFVKRAPILLLDEATSALDSETERKVQAALDKLIAGATVFAIAHRLSTITHAEQIVVLDAGRIVERGTHEQLLARGSRYASLYRSQVGIVSAGASGQAEAVDV